MCSDIEDVFLQQYVYGERENRKTEYSSEDSGCDRDLEQFCYQCELL